MLDSLRSSRALRGVLVALLSPLLVLGLALTPSPANAATKRGPAVAFNFSWDGLVPGAYGDCTGSANWARVNDQDPSIHISGLSCDWGWNFDGSLDGGDDDYLIVSTGCDTADGHLFNYSSSSFDLGSPDAFDLAPDPEFDVPENCNVTSLRFQFREEGWGQDSDFDRVVTIALGTPPAPTAPEAIPPADDGSCPVIKFDRVPKATIINGGPETLDATVEVQSGISWKVSPGYSAYAIPVYVDPTRPLLANGDKPVGPLPTVTFPAPAVDGSATYGWSNVSEKNNAYVLGVQVYVLNTGGGPWTGYPSDAFDQRLPQNSANGDLGLTVLSKCRFYFGEKIARTTTDSWDEPLGPIRSGADPTDDPQPDPVNDPAEDVSEEGCDGFSFTDPASWAGAGICMLVKAVGRLIEVVGGIASAILNGLTGLFVPSDGYLDGQIDGVKDAWANAAPVAFMSGFTDVGEALQFPQPSNSCEGPALNFQSPLGSEGSSAVSVNPLSTCRDEVGQIADLTKTVLTIAVYVGAVLASVRIVGAAFGVNLGLGGKEAEA